MQPRDLKTKSALQLLNEERASTPITTFVKELDNLLGGGVALGQLTGARHAAQQYWGLGLQQGTAVCPSTTVPCCSTAAYYAAVPRGIGKAVHGQGGCAGAHSSQARGIAAGACNPIHPGRSRRRVIMQPHAPRLQCTGARHTARVRVAGGGWRVAGGGWRVAGGGWRVAGGGWWMVDGEWRVMLGGVPPSVNFLKV